MASDDGAEDPLAVLVDALAIVHGLTIEPEWRPAVLANMSAIAQAARLVMAYPLDDADEAAPVFAASWPGR